MQLGYDIETPIALPGMPQGPGRERSYRNPLLAPIWTFLVGGTATDGDYTLTLTDDETGDSVTVTVTRATTPATNADIAAALQAELADLGSPWSQRFIATVDTATGTIAFRDPQRGRAWTVTQTAPAPGTITLTETQSEGGASVPMGVWIKREAGTDETLARLVAGDALADLVGITLRPLAAFIENPGDRSTSARDQWPVGEIVPVRRRGWVWVEVEEAVTPDSPPFVRVDASTTGVSGAMRASADGGAAVDASSKCRFLRSASAGELALVELFDAAYHPTDPTRLETTTMQTQAIQDAIARYQGLAALTDREMIADAIGRMDGLARADATLMPIFARQLEHIYSEIEKIEYPELAAANGDVLPVDSSIPEGASTWTYRQYDAVGFAKFWSPMADDIPMATFTGQEFSGPLRYIVEGFAYNLFDLKALKFAGVEAQLDSLRAEMVRRHHDQTINRAWLFGEEDIGLLGLLTHPNITITDVPAGASTFTPWANKTAAEIIADIADGIDSVDETSLGVEKVDAAYFPRAQLNLIKRLPVGDAFPNTTVFAFLFGPGGVYSDVKTRAVNELATANSFGNLDLDVAVFTTTNVRKAAFVSQEDFKMLPPIELGLKFEIHTYSGIGGCRLRRPLAVHLIRGI